MTPKELREKKARCVTQARGYMAEAEKEKDEAKKADLLRQADEAIAEGEGYERQAETMEREERMGRLETGQDAGDPRRPVPSDGEGRAQEGGEAITYRQAFMDYVLAGGLQSELLPEARNVLRAGFTPVSGEQRAQTSTNAEGGFLIPEEAMPGLVQAMIDWGPMYDDDFCTVLNTTGGGTIPIPGIDDTASTAEATATEGADLTDDGGKDIVATRKELGDYMFDTEWLRISPQLASGSFMNFETILNGLLGERLGRKANAQLTLGTGTGQPQGIVTGATASGVTTAATDGVTGDELIAFFHSIGSAYRRSPKFRAMFNDNTLAALHKLKDGQGNYLIRLAPDGSGRIVVGAVTIPYAVNDDMASMGASATPIVAGDFSRYYVRKIGGIILGAAREKFWPNVGIAGYARLDGVVADTKAIKTLANAAV